MQLRRIPARQGARRAFTLMEVLVVVAIIVVLAGVATVSFRYLTDTKNDIAKVKIKKIEDAASQYKLKYGDYPDSIAILGEPIEGSEAYLSDEDIKDPWGNPYVIDKTQLHPKTRKPKIYSQGEPGKSHPISNW
jgi:general secretion pathway protein G